MACSQVMTKGGAGVNVAMMKKWDLNVETSFATT
jgi:hypothetical protein